MPKALQENSEHVATLIREIFNELPSNGEIDLVEDLAGKIPMVVICDILGIPKQDWAYLIKLGTRQSRAPTRSFSAMGRRKRRPSDTASSGNTRSN